MNNIEYEILILYKKIKDSTKKFSFTRALIILIAISSILSTASIYYNKDSNITGFVINSLDKFNSCTLDKNYISSFKDIDCKYVESDDKSIILEISVTDTKSKSGIVLQSIELNEQNQDFDRLMKTGDTARFQLMFNEKESNDILLKYKDLDSGLIHKIEGKISILNFSNFFI